jgi:hypothetical protein
MTTSIAPSHTRRRCIGKTAFNSLLKGLLLCLVLFTSFKSFGQTIKTYAGNGTGAFSGDGGAATSASLNNPTGVAVDGSGNLYIADFNNNRIRKVSVDGIISTVAGNGTEAFSGDGGAATSASLNNSFDVAVDGAGNLYIADTDNQRIRKVSVDGTIATVAGNGLHGFTGDGGAAISASLYSPRGVAVDGAGNLYIGDSFNQRIRKMSLSTVTGIFDEGEMSKTLAYPNPAKGYVFISAESEIKQVRLLNAFGALVLTSQPNARQARLDLGTLSAGVYTAVVTAKSRVFTRKIIVVK